VINQVQSIDTFKNILRDAVEVHNQLSVKSKQQIIEFKKKLEEYTKLVNEYTARPSDISADGVWEEGVENETQMGILLEELNRIGTEINLEVAVVKNAFK
jgi:hypothetical protein